MATVRKRKWTSGGTKKTAWIADYFDQDGTRRQRTFKLKREAEDWLAKTQIEVKDRIHTPDHKSLTVSEVADLWLHQKKLDGCRESTLIGCRNRVKNHIHSRAIGKEKLSRLIEPMCLAFYNEIAEEISRFTAHTMLKDLKGILHFAMRMHFVQKNVAALIKVSRPAKRRKMVGREIPTKADVKLLIEKAARGWRHDLLVTAALTGMRSGELRALHWEDVDFDNKVIHVCHNADRWNNIVDPKSEAGQRSIPMAPMVFDTLWRRAYCAEEDRIAAFRERLDKYVAEGTRLLATKATLERGEWMDWLGEHTDRPFRTPRLYMQLARDNARHESLPSNVVTLTKAKPKGLVFVMPRTGAMFNHSALGDMFNVLQTKIGLVEVNPDRRVGYRSFTERRAIDSFALRVMPIIREIQASGIVSAVGIARALTERGVPTPRDVPRWNYGTVQNMFRHEDRKDPRYSFHSLRHFAASLFIERGFSAKRLQQIMGHSSIQMTFDIYGHWFPSPEDDHQKLAAAQDSVFATSRDTA